MTGPLPIKSPIGFAFSGIASGIKARRKDLGLIVSDAPAVAVGRLTQSASRAAPVRYCAARLPSADVRAIVVASGNANACTGARSEADNERMAKAVAKALDVSDDAVLTAATGVIGVPFPIERMEAKTPDLVAAISDDPVPAAEALLTTDTFTKLASREIYVGGARVRVMGLAKGSGMVHPNMATVLAFLLTDCAIEGPALDAALGPIVDETFNALSIDGQTSTNDSVIALANGLAENPPITAVDSEAGRAFSAALAAVARELALAIARDGEGARRLVTVRVTGAESEPEARAFARAVVSSSLVKAALFGADPGYGRILAALGACAAERALAFDVMKTSVRLQDFAVFENGAPRPFDADALRARLRQRDVDIDIDIAQGSARGEAFGCDLSYDYVRINADYAAVLVAPEGGPVLLDKRLETKTPELKTEMLVSALRYIDRFAGTRAVIRYGAATLGQPSLALSFAEDVRLLTAVGLSPILVQQGSSEIVVTALARAGKRALGLSGADGNLLAWPKEGSPTDVKVDPDVIETLLTKGYIPVIVPELTEEAAWVTGSAGLLDVDHVAAEIAVACGAKKILFLGESPGLMSDGLLVSELSAEDLAERVVQSSIDPALVLRARAASRALARGVDSAHFLDERIPHVVVAELFTDSGVGTMVR